eukprot:scaffold102324_cov26-Tisochrysis_lutea.AAC.1
MFGAREKGTFSDHGPQGYKAGKAISPTVILAASAEAKGDIGSRQKRKKQKKVAHAALPDRVPQTEGLGRRVSYTSMCAAQSPRLAHALQVTWHWDMGHIIWHHACGPVFL